MTGQVSSHPKARLQHYAVKMHTLSSCSSASLSIWMVAFIYKGQQVYVSKSAFWRHSVYDFPMNGNPRCNIQYLGCSLCTALVTLFRLCHTVLLTLESWRKSTYSITHAEEADETYCESQPMLYCTASESFVLPLVDSSSSSSSWSRAFATGSVHPQRFCVCGWPTFVSMDGGGLH